MKFFIDTADINEIKELAATGMVDGVTTNPSLAAKSGKKFLDLVREICAIVPGPVSAEVTALDYATMMKEAAVLRKIATNVTIKVPLTPDGLKGPVGRGENGQRHPVLLARPSTFGRQGGSQLYFTLRWAFG